MRRNMMKEKNSLRIRTKLGDLVVCVNKEPEYPALWVSLDLGGNEIPLTTVEVVQPGDDTPKLQTIIYADAQIDAPTSIIQHTGIKKWLYERSE